MLRLFIVCADVSDALLCDCNTVVLWIVFFFKQKTAYEMRISDWSSDVCSSDLLQALAKAATAGPGSRRPALHASTGCAPMACQSSRVPSGTGLSGTHRATRPSASWNPVTRHSETNGPICFLGKFTTPTTRRPTSSSTVYKAVRSEEHTSELQSLMRT